MPSLIRRRPSPSMTVALLALVLALGGTSYAAVKLPKNSVGADQIKANAVTGAKIKDRSLFANDFAAGQLPRGPQGATGAQGTKGETGAQGAKGETGAQGPAGLAHVIVRRRSDQVPIGTAAGASVNLVTMQLPPGRWVLSSVTNGGYYGAPGSTFRCYLLVNGVPQEPHTTLALGLNDGTVQAAQFTPGAVVDSGSPSTVVLHCNHESPIASGAFGTPAFNASRIVAIRADTLDAQDQ